MNFQPLLTHWAQQFYYERACKLPGAVTATTVKYNWDTLPFGLV